MTPTPPKGFIFASHGPLAHPSPTPTRDILWCSSEGEWFDWNWDGNGSGPYAVREGSPIAIANGLSPAPPAEPDSALAAFNALAEQINAKLDALNARLDRMEARAAAMETVVDPTMRELPWNPEWPKPPPLPEGKTRWVNRGDEWTGIYNAENRTVRWLQKNPTKWMVATEFSHIGIHHIEAV